MTLCYYDGTTAYHITDLITSAQWETKRTGSPSKLSISALLDSQFSWQLGSVVTLQTEDSDLFYGYVFSVTLEENKSVSVVAYDQMRYLKNKETYVFTNQRADQIIAQVCQDFGLQVGTLPNTGYMIPSLVEDQTSLFDICLGALEETLNQGGGRYTLWDDYGILQLSEVTSGSALLVLGDSSLVTSYSHQQSIDEETYNRVVVSQQDGDSRIKYIAEATDNQSVWGLLQLSQNATTATNDPQGLADSLLSLYNQASQTVTLKAMAQPTLRAGDVVQVSIADAGLETTCLVEEVVQDLFHQTMTLKVSVYPC
ncbi:hypothetical protein RFF05_01825 [Bengtsoniella intestinalis]|uniref:XkdQ/YqbQ family protein n=1 Tax=Bengtsoniella intestinalis TaxID=3073143 RepID=UPI00391EEB2A